MRDLRIDEIERQINIYSKGIEEMPIRMEERLTLDLPGFLKFSEKMRTDLIKRRTMSNTYYIS